MIKPELYKRSTDILYQAYFNHTLEHGNCYACAVGNLVAANCGYEFQPAKPLTIGIEWREIPYPMFSGWGLVFLTSDKRQKIAERYYEGAAKEQIDSTGYTWQELAKIEYAFETAPKGKSDEDYMFNGLVAVLEVLKDIHQVTDEDLIQGNNKRFKDHYAKRKIYVRGF